MIEYGAVFHVAGVPALHAVAEKDRYVVVIDPRVGPADAPVPLGVLCVIPSATAVGPSRIELPHHGRTGFARQCWAVPEWVVQVMPCWLNNRVGALTRLELKPTADAIAKLIASGHFRDHPPQVLQCPPPEGRQCEHCRRAR